MTLYSADSLPLRPLAFAAALAGVVLSLTSVAASAQDAEHDWHKQYQVSGKPSLNLETGDASVEIGSCGDCKAIHIRVHTDRKLSDFRLEEHQEGDRVSFLFKEKPQMFHVNWNGHNEKTEVTVETPGTLTLDARSGDGNVRASHLTGELTMHSSDGSVALDDVHGALRLTSSDGNMDVHNASGTLEAHGSDGGIKIDGKFTAVQAHTSDGSLDLSLAPGSQLESASRLESSDGSVTLHVAKDLSADLDVSASDGHIDCSLPMTLDHDHGGQHLHSRLNAGGVPLTVRTSDGSVRISAL